MDVRPDELDLELADLELRLRELSPSKLPRGLAERLAAAMAGATVDGHDGSKVVAFPVPGTSAAKGSVGHSSRRSLWGAAAAVAAMGAAAALWITPDPAASVAKAETRKPLMSATPAGGSFMTAGYGRNVREASDEGVVWSQGQVPHRRVRVVYVDKAVMINPQGERIEVERPRVEWLLVPEKMD